MWRCGSGASLTQRLLKPTGDVAIERCDGSEFSTPALVATTGLPTSTVHCLLSRSKRAGFIRRTGIVTPERVALYERRPHPLGKRPA